MDRSAGMLWTNQSDPLGKAMRLAMRSSPHSFSSLAHIDTEEGRGGDCRRCLFHCLFVAVTRQPPPTSVISPSSSNPSPLVVCLPTSDLILSITMEQTLPYPNPSLPHEWAQTKKWSSARRHPLPDLFLSVCVFFFSARRDGRLCGLFLGCLFLSWGHIVCHVCRGRSDRLAEWLVVH